MAAFTISCSICDKRKRTSTCNVWCLECEEGLCLECKEHHSQANASKGHTTLSITDYQSLPAFITDIKQNCGEHNERYTMFCTKHESPCCSKCYSANHKECKDIKQIEEVVENVKTSSRFEELEILLDKMSNDIKQVNTNMHTNIAEISKSKKKIETQIRELKEQIIAHLDKIERELLTELNTVTNKSNGQIQKITESMTKLETDVRECTDTLVTIKQHASDLQTFLGLKHLEDNVTKNVETLQTFFKDQTLHNDTICCQIEAILESFAQKVQCFGSITVVTTPCNITFQSQAYKKAQMKVPKGMSELEKLKELELWAS